LGVEPTYGDLHIDGGAKDMYSEYSNLSVESVAQSNGFYRKYVDDETFTENLKLTLDYMKNNVTDNLWNKLLDKYKPFQEKKKGGPFFQVDDESTFIQHGIGREGASGTSREI
jgi:methyltransferase-like protein